MTPDEFLSSAPATTQYQGSSPWAERLSARVQAVVLEHYRQQPRTRQRNPGPSQLGSNCDRQIVAQFLGLPAQNTTTDPWAAIIGTATHTWLASAFTQANVDGQYFIEHRVKLSDAVSGSSDLYWKPERAVIDHKVLGPTTLSSLKSSGPSLKYVRQLLLYAHGFRQAGQDPQRIAIVGYPRNGRLRDTYVWDSLITPELEEDLQYVLNKTDERLALAGAINRGETTIEEVPIHPTRDCYYCPFYCRTAGEGFTCAGQQQVVPR